MHDLKTLGLLGALSATVVLGASLPACSAAGGNIAPGGGGGADNGAGGALFNLGGSGAGTSGGGAGGFAPGIDGHIGPANIAECADASQFQGGATAGNRLVYPYDGTIFPRGLGGPILMWDAPAEQVLVEAKSKGFSYTHCGAPPDPKRFPIADAVWAGAGSWSEGPGDPLVVSVTVLSGGKAIGPVTVNLKFALATLKGAIYYNTYDSKLVNNSGAVLKLLPGAAAPTVFLSDTGIAPFGPCRSCHSLSANGTTMTANRHIYPGSYVSESYDVTGPQPVLIKSGILEAGFAAVYPDGSRLITNGPPNVSVSAFFPTAPGDVTALTQSTSKMLDPKTGNVMPAPGWDGVVPHAQMPMFSPDGRHIVYNDYDKGQGHSLFVADFELATNTFSGIRQIFNDPKLYAAWPFFTPDSKQVIFALDTRPDFTSQVPDPLLATASLTPTGRGHLVVIDVATGTAHTMDLANGYKNGASYLPAGEARDNNLEFFTTVSPVGAGGFYWALFTSRRTYGNLWAPDLEDPKSKKIWVTAVDIDSKPGTDPSHPAFLLPGQEIDTGNIRAFAALEPCKEDGSACASGTECCKGYCTNVDPATGRGTCGHLEMNTCAQVDDKCAQDGDCCNQRPLRCINQVCTQILN